jgi:hypothetical protein
MRKVSWRLALPAILVGALLIASVLLVSGAHFRRGSACLAGALALTGAMRAVLTTEQLGPLAVRSKTFDVLFCMGLALLIVYLAA